jgi:two-component system chemotaxis response regulator CheY
VLGDHWVDLVFADINMPVMNGEEMIDRIRDDPAWKELPIVVISTEGSETRIESLHNKGAEFVHKPFTPEIIRNVLETMLGIDHGQHA